MSQLKIGIIGASVAGCAAAILLERLGYHVEVFEKRALAAMNELGAGIVLPPDLVASLKDNNLLDQDFPTIQLNDRIFFLNSTPPKKLASVAMSGLAINWGILYTHLAKRLPKNNIFYHAKVTKIETRRKSVILTINHAQEHEFDFVIAADGYRSQARKFLFPDALPQFSNYTCWQGNFITNDKNITEEISNHAFYYLYDKGILLAYIIPNQTNTNNSTTITWFLYETIDSTHPFVQDNVVHVNIYQNEMKEKYIHYLHQLATNHFTALGQKIICGTEKPFTHVIYDTMVEKYFAKNIALIGDAGILLRPHIGSGATKALQDALALSQSLKMHANMENALESWAEERQQSAAHLFTLSRAFGDFLVEKHPLWNSLDGKAFCDHWDRICEGYNWYQNK